MRPQPPIPDTLAAVADRLASYARTVDSYSRNQILLPAVVLLRQAANEFDEFSARRFDEISEGMDFFVECRDHVPGELRGRLDSLLAKRDALAGMRRADELGALADEVDYGLIDLLAWLESGNENSTLRASLRELQCRRALRWLPPSSITGGSRRNKKESIP